MMNGISADYVEYVDDDPKENGAMKKIQIWPRTQQPIIWLNTISIILFHIIAVISFFLTIHKMKILTVLWSKFTIFKDQRHKSKRFINLA